MTRHEVSYLGQVVRRDVQYALRVLRQSPFLTAALVLSLGLGTGANAAVFNLISALLLRPPAGVENASSLVLVRAIRSSAGDLGLASHADLETLRGSGALDALPVYDDSVITGATFDGTSRRVRVASVGDGLFATLRM